MEQPIAGLPNFVFKTVMKSFPVFILFIHISFILTGQEYPIDLEETGNYFKEIRSICDADNGELWGKNLWGPILLIDRDTRFLVANEPDHEGLLEKTGNVYTGYFPKSKVVANSTTDFGGKKMKKEKHF